MKTPKNIFPLSMLLISMILTGCADSTQNSNPKFSEATTTSAVTATTSAISTTSSAINASSSAMQPVDPLSVEGQLKTIAEAKDKIVTYDNEDENYHYAITDLDQNGRLELIVSTGMFGAEHITGNWYYEISKDGSKLKKCKGKAFGNEGHDICDDIDTVYIDPKKHNYYYIVHGITHVSGAENYDSVGFLQLKNGTLTDNYLAGGSHFVSKKGKLKDSYYKLTKNANKRTAIITKKQYSDIDSLMNEKYGKLKKESVAIQWFSYEQLMSEVSESQFLHKLQKSQENFAIGKKVKKCKEYNWYDDSLKNLKNIDWEEQQYNMRSEDYTMLTKYFPMLKNEQKIHFPDGTEQTLDEYSTGKEGFYRQVQLVDLTGDGIKELILDASGYVIFSYQNGKYEAFLPLSDEGFNVTPGGYFCYDMDNEANEVYTRFTSKLQYKDGKLQEVIVAKGESDYKNDTDIYHINGLLASEDTYCDWQVEKLYPDNEPYEVYKYVLEEKEE
ncbi:MAG: hypothetical protein ACLTHS_10640 [Eubacterium sp.]|nr:MAG: hypothetical protein DBY03_07260 [Clostridiales bacterium]